jgi:methyl-accepting chemotaxis protein
VQSGNKQVTLADQQYADLQLLRQGILEIDALIDEKIQAAIDRDSPEAMEKLEAALDMEININEAYAAVEAYLVEPAPELRQQVADAEADFEQFEAQYRGTTLSVDEEQWLEQIDKDFAEFKQAGDEIMDLQDQKLVLEEELLGQITQMDQILDEQVQPLIQAEATKAAEDATRSAGFARLAVLIMGAFILVLGSGAAIIISRMISVPITKMADTASRLAGGDVEQIIEVSSNDEVGVLADAFGQMIAYQQEMAEAANRLAEGDLTADITPQSEKDALGNAFSRMIVNLRNLIGQVQQSAGQVANASQQLNVSSAQSSQAGQQVATTIQQVAQGTSQQTQAVTGATSSIEQISHAAEGIARGSQDQAQSVQQTSDLIDEMATIVGLVGQVSDTVTKANVKVTQAAGDGATTITQTSQGMEAIRSRTAVTAEKIKEMGARSKEIDRIIETIDNIADKTDMLALNAAVEAARAGEAGRGFAVVADQVRKLSEDSKVATRDIANLIEGVQDTINETVTAMHSTTVEVDNGVKLTQNTTQSLQDILQAAEEAAGQAERIDQAVTQLKQKNQGVVTAIEAVGVVVEENTAVAEEMAANSQEVTGAMEGVAGIAEENSASAEEVSALAEEMSAQAEEVVASVEELSALAEELHTSVAQFRVDETVRIERDREQPRAQTTAGHQDAVHQDGGHEPQPVTAPMSADPQHDGHGEDETPLAI